MTSDTTFSITTFNVQNLFPAFSDPLQTKAGSISPGDEAVKRIKLRRTIHETLALPEIIALQEIGDEQILQQLAGEINNAAGTAYAAAAPHTSDRRGIRLGFMWDTARVKKEKIWQLDGEDVAAAFGAVSPNPGREPLAATFVIAGRPITILNNHLKSNYIPEADAENAEEIRGANSALRLAQAQVLRDFAAAQLAADPAAWLLITGDFNDGSTAVDAPLGYLLHHPPPLIRLLPPAEEEPPYTLQYAGVRQLLDHMLASQGMAEGCTAVRIDHINAAADPLLALDPTVLNRSSDHDPLTALFSW
jgi:predicted extracellular nuclease